MRLKKLVQTSFLVLLSIGLYARDAPGWPELFITRSRDSACGGLSAGAGLADVGVPGLIAEKMNQASRAQGGVLLPQVQQRAHMIEHLPLRRSPPLGGKRILRVTWKSAGKVAAVVRILSSLHPDFIASKSRSRQRRPVRTTDGTTCRNRVQGDTGACGGIQLCDPRWTCTRRRSLRRSMLRKRRS